MMPSAWKNLSYSSSIIVNTVQRSESSSRHLLQTTQGGDFPAEELYQFHLIIDALSSLHRSDQTGVGGGKCAFGRTAANQQKLYLVDPNSLPFLFSVCQKGQKS